MPTLSVVVGGRSVQSARPNVFDEGLEDHTMPWLSSESVMKFADFLLKSSGVLAQLWLLVFLGGIVIWLIAWWPQ